MPVRQRDLSEPDFPHGTLPGYRHGCKNGQSEICPATPTCAAVRAEYDRKIHKARTGGKRALRYRTAPVRKYMQSWLAKGWPHETFARAADIDPTTVRNILARRFKTLLPVTAHSIVNVDEAALIAATTGSGAKLPAYLIRWKIGAMCAQGWPCAVQAARTGYATDRFASILSGKAGMVTRALFDDFNDFYDRFQKVPCASPQARQARNIAARLGYRTPDCYAPDGTLWEDDVRDEEREEQWARRDREALLYMRVAQMAVKYNMGLHVMAVELDMDNPTGEQVIRRCRSALGLKWVGGKDHGPEPGQEERIAEILAVVEEWRRAGPLADPYPFCRKLGLMGAHRWAALDGKPRLEAAA